MDTNLKSALPPGLLNDEICEATFVEAFIASPAATLRDLGLLRDPSLTKELEVAMYGAATTDCVRPVAGLKDLAVKVTAGGAESR